MAKRFPDGPTPQVVDARQRDEDAVARARRGEPVLMFDPTGDRERVAAQQVEAQAEANAKAVVKELGLDGVRGDRIRWALDKELIKKTGW
jgi:hypothetical protein